MNTPNDKEIIKKEFFKNKLFEELCKYQTMSGIRKAQLFCFVQLDNCADVTSYDEYLQRKYNTYNTYQMYQSFLYYKSLFKEYLNNLNDEETLYPDLESFLDLLFIEGEYNFLNFVSPSNEKTIEEIDENGDLVKITYFYIKENNPLKSHYEQSRKKCTRIKKGNVIRFFYGELTEAKHFYDKNCYLTLTTDGIYYNDFKNCFSSKYFKNEYDENETPQEFKVNNLIKKMINLGESFSESINKGEKIDEIIEYIPNNEEKEIDVFLNDEKNTLICDNFKKNIRNTEELKNGSIIEINNQFYQIENIFTSRKKHIKIIVSKKEILKKMPINFGEKIHIKFLKKEIFKPSEQEESLNVFPFNTDIKNENIYLSSLKEKYIELSRKNKNPLYESRQEFLISLFTDGIDIFFHLKTISSTRTCLRGKKDDDPYYNPNSIKTLYVYKGNTYKRVIRDTEAHFFKEEDGEFVLIRVLSLKSVSIESFELLFTPTLKNAPIAFDEVLNLFIKRITIAL